MFLNYKSKKTKNSHKRCESLIFVWNNVYASIAVANREPIRKDFRENTPDNQPKSEKLINLESGYRYKGQSLMLNANIYYMHYTNQEPWTLFTGKPIQVIEAIALIQPKHHELNRIRTLFDGVHHGTNRYEIGSQDLESEFANQDY